MPDYTYQDVAKMIDHSLLAADADRRRAGDGLPAGPRVRRRLASASSPTPSRWPRSSSPARSVAVGTTIGFPHGGHVTPIKVAEAEAAPWTTARASWTWSSTSARC